jgi:hypothetical protein
MLHRRSCAFSFAVTLSQALRAGKLQIGRGKRRAAPLVKTSPVPTEAELNAEMLIYQYSAGVLSSSEADGVIRVKNMRQIRSPGKHAHHSATTISFRRWSYHDST